MEKVKPLPQYREIREHLRFWSGVVYDARQEPALVLEKVFTAPDYHYFIDEDGDVARRPQGTPWTPPAAEALPMAPLAAFAEVPSLATVRFAPIPYGTVTYYESELLEPDRALALWAEATACRIKTGLSAVIRDRQVRQHELEDDRHYGQIPADRQKAAELDLAAYLAKRQDQVVEILADCIDDEGQSRPGDELLAEQAEGLAQLALEELGPVPPEPFYFQTSGSYVVLVLVACEPWELPACIGFGDWNLTPVPAEHSAVLREWSRRFGAELVATGCMGHVEERTRRRLTPEEIKTLAWEMFIFSFDTVLEDTNTVAALAKNIARGHWFMVWR